MRYIPVIQSQLAPPPVRNRFIQRSKLNKKLMTISNYPLTLLYAGAGYGKSTALALFLQNKNSLACWYSISQNDDDLIPFLTKLMYAVRQQYPEFGRTIQHELENLDNYITIEEIYSLASSFVNDTLACADELTIVLDDFHHVLNSSEIEKWMLFLFEHIPANLHLIVSSRKRPKWEVLPKLKGQGELLEITYLDLVLSPDEMAYMLEEKYEVNITKEEVSRIYQLTEGWAIAFNMLVQQMNAGMTIKAILRNQKRSLRDLFDYLAAEVLSKQSLIIQQFLMQSSVLDVLSPKVCDSVLQIQGSEEILHGLAEQNLFIVEGDYHHFRYHALFKTFLENYFMRNYENEFIDLHIRAAQHFEKQDDNEAALYHYERASDYNKFAHLLNKHGLTILQSGRLQTLYDLLLALPNENKQQYPVLYFYQGEIERYRSLYDQAIANYETIINLQPKEYREGDYLRSLALEGMARIYLDTIQPDIAERYLSQAIQLRGQTAVRKEEMAKLYALMAENLLNSGQAKKAEAWYDRAKKLNIPLEESNLQSRIYLRTGRLAKAKEVLLLYKRDAGKGNRRHLSQSHRETDIILSIIEAFMGNAEESKKFAENGIQLGLSIQSPFVEACGWMRLGHGVQLIDRYDTKLAAQCYETALEIMEKINVSRGKAEPYMGLSLLNGKNQVFDQAMKHASSGLIETEKVKDRWLSTLIKLSIGITKVYQQHYDEAAEIMKQVNAEMAICGDRYGIMLTSFWSAYISYEQGKSAIFEQEIGLFLEAIQTEEYEFFLKKQTTFGPIDMQNIVPMLLEAKKLDIKTAYVSRLLYELGLDAAMKNHPGYTMVIHALGRLNIWIGTKQIEPQQWQREKAKELFELFLTNRNKLLVKEEIFQSLWPEQDENAANKNFKVALNALYKAIEPQRKAREESFFILRKGSSYGLNPNAGFELDSIQFEELIENGLKEKDSKRAKELLEKGLKLYQGDYLADLRFASWCTHERERLQLIFLRGAEKLAQVSVRLENLYLCMHWCERILSIDNTWEEAYRLIMYYYYQNNNRPQAIKWYEKCFEVLADELGVEPMESTKEMYHLIMESEELDTYK
ncbi:transcriptional regulator [Oceanobacillus zhaokaii]|uniref:Transcriptional regulator n=1 Tax=Oceanobacillus zhaokaii TaxID=2052660 RepID=A0A345PDU5_9BACI|nr:BTAD domain-containing putative transcriptional regulator [Oceanobacillus zhaokaii]AXI08175.1 transcriptional regulator [Oceanobacillus zhaokaii]